MLTVIGIAVFLSVLTAAFALKGYRQRNPILERIEPPRSGGRKLTADLTGFWGLSEVCPLTFEQALTVGVLSAAVVFGLSTLLVDVITAAVLAVLCFLFVPRLAVKLTANKKVKEFKSALEFGVDVLLAGLSAGMTLDAALAEAGRTSPEPVKSEFIRAAEEIKNGELPVKAFESMARRIPCLESEELRDAVELYTRVGGPDALGLLKSVVTNLREGMNARFQVDQYVRGAKTTAVMVTLVPIVYVAIMAFIAPDLFSTLVSTDTGRTVIFGCLLMFGFGVWMLWNILRGIEDF